MSSNPFLIEITTGKDWGRPHKHDDEPFRFFNGSQDYCSAAFSFADSIPNGVIQDYRKQIGGKWISIPEANWRLGSLIECYSDKSCTPPPHLKIIPALAYALGVTRFAEARYQAYDALLRRAQSEVQGSTLSWAEIARRTGLKQRRLDDWRKLPDFKKRLKRARSAFNRGRQIVIGPGGLPFPGEEWLDPKDEIGWELENESGWELEVEEISQDIIQRVRAKGGRYVPAQLRQAMFTIIAWHYDHKRVLSPTAIKALGCVMGLKMDEGQSNARPPHRDDYKSDSDVDLVASIDASLKLKFDTVASALALSQGLKDQGLTIPRQNIERWRKSSPQYSNKFAKDFETKTHENKASRENK